VAFAAIGAIGEYGDVGRIGGKTAQQLSGRGRAAVVDEHQLGALGLALHPLGHCRQGGG